MMHYRPLIHQQMLVEQHPYYQYAMNEMQMFYSSSEHQEEDNDHTGDEIPSETSGDQSPNTDMFRLAFAASQWSKLVLNAEGLFNKLMSTNVLSPNEQNLLKNQIEQWLCMKQEYEECIGADDSGSLQGYTENTRRSLERIEEVTETDEKTDESNNWMKMQSKTKSCSGSESEIFDDDDDDPSNTESENPDFLEKLEEYMKKFKDETDELVDSQKTNSSKMTNISPVPKPIINSSFVPIVKPIPIRISSSRRMSILPYSEMSNELAEFQKQNSNINLRQKEPYIMSPLVFLNFNEKNGNPEKPAKSFEKESEKAVIKANDVTVDPEHASTIKSLIINNDKKLSQIKNIQFDLDLAYKQLEELQNTIKVKEQFIEDMLQNCVARNNAKQKFQRKRSKIEEKYRDIEKTLNYKRMHRDIEDEYAYREEIEKYEKLLMYYEKKLKDTKIIKQVVGNSEKTVAYLKNSLSESKNQMEKLQQRLTDEEERKKSLEDELNANKKIIKELGDKYSLTASKLKEMFENENARSHNRLRITSDDKDKSLIEENDRMHRLSHILKEKLDVEKVENTDETETLRQEIRNLRHIRDRLIDMKCKYVSDRIPTTNETQRQLLLISEYVETIDAMIEQKNVMICGRQKENQTNRLDQTPILSRLEKLSYEELITLFYKYFHKVIDLKDSSRNLEIQNATLEETLKQQEIDHDTRMIMLQKSYERQISLLLNYYAEETSSSGYDNKLDRNQDVDRLLRENQAMRRRLAHFDSLFKASGKAKTVPHDSVKPMKQVLKPDLMQLTLPKPPPNTTKVTRQGNKLIFQRSENEE